jgi:hypothetical protein
MVQRYLPLNNNLVKYTHAHYHPCGYTDELLGTIKEYSGARQISIYCIFNKALKIETNYSTIKYLGGIMSGTIQLKIHGALENISSSRGLKN